MDTILLARTIGLFLLVIGVFRLTNQRAVLDFLERFFANRSLTYLYGLIAVPAAVGLVATQTKWDSLLATTIAVLSWFLLVEALVYLLLPKPYLAAIFDALQRKTIYFAVAATFIVVGCYLLLATTGT